VVFLGTGSGPSSWSLRFAEMAMIVDGLAGCCWKLVVEVL
jgi:hypothetical protein